MAHRRQIAAIGWSAVFEHEDGSYSTTPLVCFEILCTDEEDENDYSHYGHEFVKTKSGSAIEAVGLTFLNGHPSRQPDRYLSEVFNVSGFIGYLPPGLDLDEWLKGFKREKSSD